MRRFKSINQAQKFLSAHAVLHNLFNRGRGMVSAEHYRTFREGAFAEWIDFIVSKLSVRWN